MTRIKFAAALAAALFLTAVGGQGHAQTGKDFNETARYLAGLPSAADGAGAMAARDATWQQHAKYFDSAWDKLDKQQLSKVRAWSAAQLKAGPRPLFYTFSGPDFIYANSFFPEATTYVLAGLEPVGSIPAITPRTRYNLGGLRGSLNTILNISFFITSDMSSRLRDGELRGTLPILYVFLARAGKTIHEVSLVDLDRHGVAHDVAQHSQKRGERTDPGVRIVFSQGSGPRQTLYYFATDLSDGGTKASGFLAFCEKLGTGDSLIKSASYLLHGNNFSHVRKFLLDRSQTIVQDDTGVPARLFKQEDWLLKPFGAYLGPIEIFPGMYQPQLAQIFRQGKAPKLDFGIGYRWRGHDSNLLLAIKKNTVAGRN
ncbi:MAG TPA: hypothetical protein VFY21_13770 [Xanthobacteraceae bacterium]|nr:hypothetical protein [Xanthobacteraceae bacterium]